MHIEIHTYKYTFRNIWVLYTHTYIHIHVSIHTHAYIPTNKCMVILLLNSVKSLFVTSFVNDVTNIFVILWEAVWSCG